MLHVVSTSKTPLKDVSESAMEQAALASEVSRCCTWNGEVHVHGEAAIRSGDVRDFHPVSHCHHRRLGGSAREADGWTSITRVAKRVSRVHLRRGHSLEMLNMTILNVKK